MFEQVFENLQKATESSVQMQQEMFKKWVDAFPSAVSSMPAPMDALGQWRDKWEEISTEMLKRQKELVDQNYEAGLKSLEDVFRVGEAKNPQEYQQKVTELYQKSFESLRKLTESQINEFKSATEKWSELMTTND